MPDTPLTTFTLEAEKSQSSQQLKFECKINSDLLRNGVWKLEIKSLAFTNIRPYIKREEQRVVGATYSPIFELNCNLISNNFKWFENIIGRYGQKQLYRDLYPIEYVQFDPWNTNREQLIMLKGQKHHISTSSSDEISIVMKPISDTYKFNDISCSASVMISLYKD